jgi:tRNA-dihydrouridine synthase A
LNYETVFRLKKEKPDLEIVINGGITELEQALELLNQIDGVMIGREAYHNPYFLADVDQRIFSNPEPVKSRYQIIEELLPYIELQIRQGHRLNTAVRHILGLFHGQPGGRLFRRYLSENAARPEATIKVLLDAVAFTGHSGILPRINFPDN